MLVGLTNLIIYHILAVFLQYFILVFQHPFAEGKVLNTIASNSKVVLTTSYVGGCLNPTAHDKAL